MEVTVIGMGHMGRAVAGRLLDGGHRVTVWNRTPGRVPELVAAGAREAPSMAEAVRGAEAVLVSLADDAAVREVVTGNDGLARHLPSNAVLVDTSTVHPSTTRDEADAVGGDRFVAAPILGAPAAVASGQAAYLLGGPRAARQRLEPVWSTLSALHRECGEDPARAISLKILCNYLLMSGIAVLAEVVAMAQACGMADDEIRELGALPLVAPALHNRLDDIVGGDHRGWFPARLGAKDVGLVRVLASDLGVELDLAEAVARPYERLINEGRGDLDIAGVVELYRRPGPSTSPAAAGA